MQSSSAATGAVSGSSDGYETVDVELALTALLHRPGQPGTPIAHLGWGVAGGAGSVFEHPLGVGSEQQRQAFLRCAARPQRVSRSVLVGERDNVQHQRRLQELPQARVSVERSLDVSQRTAGRGKVSTGEPSELASGVVCAEYPQRLLAI